MEQGKYVQAERYFIEGLDYATKVQSQEKMQTYNNYLSELFELKQDYRTAMEYAKKSWALRDSIFGKLFLDSNSLIREGE